MSTVKDIKHSDGKFSSAVFFRNDLLRFDIDVKSG